MSVRIPAIAASVLLAGSIAVGAARADAATARIAPVIDTGSIGTAGVTVGLDHRDDCRIRVQIVLMSAASGAGILPVWGTAPHNVNACRPGFATIWEDGSVTSYLNARVPTWKLPRGLAFVGVNVWSRHGVYQPWSRHGVIRSFVH